MHTTCCASIGLFQQTTGEGAFATGLPANPYGDLLNDETTRRRVYDKQIQFIHFRYGTGVLHAVTIYLKERRNE